MSTYRKSDIPDHLKQYFEPAEIGMEATPSEYVARLVEVFREVKRVLRDDGTLWLNLGDSYGPSNNRNVVGGSKKHELHGEIPSANSDRAPKNLLGIPWRVAFALQDDGWYLRSDIIWHKPNPMPESVTDRPTKAHEYIFLLSKSPRYFYDAQAIAEETEGDSGWEKQRRSGNGYPIGGRNPDESLIRNDIGRVGKPSNTRNKRTVWTVSTAPYKGAHFATFPPKLIEPCILAGTSERGACRACGKGWKRVTERTRKNRTEFEKGDPRYRPNTYTGSYEDINGKGDAGYTEVVTTGWRPACNCNAGDPVPCVVLDPFNGSGTTGMVSVAHGRRYVGIELNPEYIKLSHERISGTQIGMQI